MILAIEAGYDSTTLPLSDARARLLHPRLKAADPATAVFAGTRARAAQVTAAGAWAARLLTASGHGDAWMLLEFGGMGPLLDGHQPPPLPAGCIVQLSACSAAGELGPALVRAGCSAVVGYDDLLLLPDDPTDLEVVVHCDGQVVVSLLAGATVGEAWRAAQSAFAAAAVSSWNAGKRLLASILEEDARRLVSPVVVPELGDPDARLWAPPTALAVAAGARRRRGTRPTG